MASPSLPLGLDQFAQGVVQYIDTYPAQQHSRIFIPVAFGDLPPTLAMVDTGSPWCILSPEEAHALDLDLVGDFLEDTKNILSGGEVKGKLYRVPVSLEAEEGAGITVMATVFIPVLMPYQEWHYPNFLGLSGFLEKTRFAVDPENNLFYFGAIAS
jgi:hypothetical protein